jgi:hypothetical protein
LTVSRRGKNIIGSQSTIGRFGLPCLPAGWRFRSKKNEENKATGIIADIHKIDFSSNPFTMKPILKSSFSFLAIIVLFSSCAEVANIEGCVTAEPYGFFFGLWHGVIAPVSFVLSVFFEDIAMYAVNNTGGWYDFGFVLGAGILFGGGGKASKRR